jgi:hypothetical protein
MAGSADPAGDRFADVGENAWMSCQDVLNRSPLPFIPIPDVLLPQRADRAAAGMMPTRAFRHCDAITTASALGRHVFPPIQGFRTVPEMAGLRAEDRNAFRSTVIRPNTDPHRQRGQYGAAERRRRKHGVEP